MTFMNSAKPILSIVLSSVLLLTTLTSVNVRAAMIGTGEVIAQQQLAVDRDALKHMLTDQQVQNKLATMGVSPEQVEQRINSLTPAELANFNTQLSQAPSGAGVVGIIVLFLVIFIITDALCVTHIFNFVHCLK
jgi:hypothetical protein